MAAYRVQAERGGASSTTGVLGGELWDAIERGFSCDPRCAISVQLARGGEAWLPQFTGCLVRVSM